jgi:hypothetical protein
MRFFLIASVVLFVTPTYAQFAYQGQYQGHPYKVFIYDKQSLGDGKWEFQTKAVYSDGTKPYYSDRKVADCFRSTIDGRVVKAISYYSVEKGDAEVLKAVCGRQ